MSETTQKSFREFTPHYIPLSEKDKEKMLALLDLKNEDELFSHVPNEAKFPEFNLFDHLAYEEILPAMEKLANKNNIKLSFLGDGLKHYNLPKILPEICNIRGLTTAYTPYQPERGQGTLIGLWLFTNAFKRLTGFEVINASFYDRSTALFEAINCAQRVTRKNKALVAQDIFPSDWEVIATLAEETALELTQATVDPQSGVVDLEALERTLSADSSIASFSFMQQNNLGLLSPVDEITDLCKKYGVKAIAIIDPALLGPSGLKPPSEYGTGATGADFLVGEAQQLGLPPLFGGPGLGLFGSLKQSDQKTLRSTAGRLVGKTVDEKGDDVFTLVLSTREQHIRREKATSNICSNQSFVATLIGASLMSLGDKGLSEITSKSRKNTLKFLEKALKLDGVDLAFGNTPFFNEVCLKIKSNGRQFIKEAQRAGIHIGVDVTKRFQETTGAHNTVSGDEHLLLIHFSDRHTNADLDQLYHFFQDNLRNAENKTTNHTQEMTLPDKMIRTTLPGIPHHSDEELLGYYQKLGELNFSPDEHVYALGSCTMKYNPWVNDEAAGLPGFAEIHPQTPEEDAQGSLELLYHIQESFKKITGLQGVCTQTVAGAQGEWVGLKMFQAYHRKHHPNEKRDIILIPHSSHGTNPATATISGFISKNGGGPRFINAGDNGMVDLSQLKEYVAEYGNRIAGIMITNPNTSGIFEADFKQISNLIHSLGGLVYMDGANMNAIAGQVNLSKIGVDAVHNNLHKTWSIPHGGGGPGDAIVAVSERLVPFIPGPQVVKNDDGSFQFTRNEHCIGSVHRHWGNFAHKVRCYTYLLALGTEGVKKMSAIAVLSARYLAKKMDGIYPFLPKDSNVPRMHEFIITLSASNFDKLTQQNKWPKAKIMGQLGKIFLDFGVHTPTVSFPEAFGLMIEPTESFTKKELDHFADILKAISILIQETPEVILHAPYFTPVKKIDELKANQKIALFDESQEFTLPKLPQNFMSTSKLLQLDVGAVCKKIIEAHKDLHKENQE